MTGPNTGYFSLWWLLLDERKSALKKLKNNIFQEKFYSLKAYAHYFTVLVYLATWRAAKLGIFTCFTFRNLSQCRQNISSLIYILLTDPQLLFMSSWSQSWSHFIVTLPCKKMFCITPWMNMISWCQFKFSILSFKSNYALCYKQHFL